MKTSMFIIFACLVLKSNAQFTSYPRVSSIGANATILSVAIDNKNTVITVNMTGTQGSFWGPFIFFPSNTYLYVDEKRAYKIESLGNELLDTKYKFEKGITYTYKLYFPKISPGVENFSIFSFAKNEYGQDYSWFKWEGIQINNPLNLNKTQWTESTLKEYFTNRLQDPREGIYECVSQGIKYILGVVKDKEEFKLVFLSSSDDVIFKEGDVKASLTGTSSENIFKAKWFMADGSINNAFITFTEGFMEVLLSGNVDVPKSNYLKLFPKASRSNGTSVSSGTGFSISPNGYVVTNNHVIAGASHITVRGINGDFNTVYKAKVLVKDDNNDLAILQVDDIRFKNISAPPFVFKSSGTDVGENVFVLGYPMRSTMGDEIKITNGIISSKTGFQGDITSYQVSAPVQPGNSGGPLFDNKGNLIGIVNAKHKGAENASYAIKVNYLINLLDALPSAPILNTQNKISNMSLPNQVKVVSKFVYIIEATN